MTVALCIFPSEIIARNAGKILSSNGNRLSSILVKRNNQQCENVQEYHDTGYNINLASLCPWENKLKSERGQFYYEAECQCDRPSASYVTNDNIRCEEAYKSLKFEKVICSSNGCRIGFVEKRVPVACVAIYSG